MTDRRSEPRADSRTSHASSYVSGGPCGRADESEKSVSAPNTSYILFLNDKEDDYHFGCTATSRAIKAEISKVWPSSEIVSVGVQEVWREGGSDRIVGLIRNAEEVFVNEEGTILGYEGRTGTQNLLKLVEVAEGLGKRVSLINYSCFPSFSPYETAGCEAIYKQIYSKLPCCLVRSITNDCSTRSEDGNIPRCRRVDGRFLCREIG